MGLAPGNLIRVSLLTGRRTKVADPHQHNRPVSRLLETGPIENAADEDNNEPSA